MNAAFKQTTGPLQNYSDYLASITSKLAPKTVAPKAPAPPTAPAPPPAGGGASAPINASPIGLAPTAPGGGKVVMPETDSMAGLRAAAGGEGGGDMGGAGDENLSGPSQFRQGVGTRILPQYSASLAALRQVY